VAPFASRVARDIRLVESPPATPACAPALRETPSRPVVRCDATLFELLLEARVLRLAKVREAGSDDQHGCSGSPSRYHLRLHAKSPNRHRADAVSSAEMTSGRE
jgi:hypothetical protein